MTLPFAIAVPVKGGDADDHRPMGIVAVTVRVNDNIGLASSLPIVQVFDDPRFVTKRRTTLMLRKTRRWLLGEDHITVCDERSREKTLLQSQQQPQTGTLTLLLRRNEVVVHDETDGKPIFRMSERSTGSGLNDHFVYEPGKTGRGDHLFGLFSDPTSTLSQVKIRSYAVNRETKHKLPFVVQADGIWRNAATAYIGDPKKGGIPIATLRRRKRTKYFGAYHLSREYIIEIASGIDMAFVVALCLGFIKG